MSIMRIDKKESGFVFDANEYIQMIKQNNTWLSVFCDVFRSGSFIISGLSFDEMDLEYYSSFRKQIATRPDSYPSVLIEPFPDSITEQNCKDLNLLLIRTTFEEFMDGLKNALPKPPTVYDLQNASDFEFDENKVAKNEIMAFYSRFEYIKIKKEDILTSQLTGFDFGHEPEVNDIKLKKDVSRKINTKVLSAISSANPGTLILVHGRMLTGKTTVALHAILDLNETEFVCFRLKCISGFDPGNVKKCIETVKKKCLLFADNIAEYMPLVIQLLDNTKNIIVLGAERDYRKVHVEQVSRKNYITINANEIENEVTERLYEKYLNAGQVKYEHDRIKECYGKTVGEQVCTL